MAKLKTSTRNALASSDFGLPSSRKYPMPDRSHAANAKARATQMVKRGKLSAGSAAKIRAKANKILGSSGSSGTHAHDWRTREGGGQMAHAYDFRDQPSAPMNKG